MSDVLCIYYSFSGNTRRAMKEIADAVGAEIVAIDDGADRNGWRGRLRAGKDAMRCVGRPLLQSHPRAPQAPGTGDVPCGLCADPQW